MFVTCKHGIVNLDYVALIQCGFNEDGEDDENHYILFKYDFDGKVSCTFDFKTEIERVEAFEKIKQGLKRGCDIIEL